MYELTEWAKLFGESNAYSDTELIGKNGPAISPNHVCRLRYPQDITNTVIHFCGWHFSLRTKVTMLTDEKSLYWDRCQYHQHCHHYSHFIYHRHQHQLQSSDSKSTSFSKSSNIYVIKILIINNEIWYILHDSCDSNKNN